MKRAPAKIRRIASTAPQLYDASPEGKRQFVLACLQTAFEKEWRKRERAEKRRAS